MLLARIVNRLKAPNHYMFIHIDKKSNIEEFKAYQPEDSHTVYLGRGNREKVFWGGLSQIMTEIRHCFLQTINTILSSQVMRYFAGRCLWMSQRIY